MQFKHLPNETLNKKIQRDPAYQNNLIFHEN